ncbi:hypothetical protein KC19_2G112000 [Ceratodon purpureus]|uniref:Uncharacterized protein n=1 Tax=Ceratodon purpureus TaxID=3225 RepID=A0A8T0ISM6_CERPU|nr:hypothetical protein KC19_2G112000 [Ceratodon purpureus]
MDNLHHQQTHDIAEGNHQQPELILFTPEQPSGIALHHLQPSGIALHHLQPSGIALHHLPFHQHIIDNGALQLNSFGEHSRPETTSNLQSCHSKPLPLVLPDSRKRKRTRERDWEVAETSVLLECVNLPKFRDQKRNQYFTMMWDAIADEIRARAKPLDSDSAITAKRCKERMKTLRGYYQQISTKKKKAGVTEDEWRKSKGIAVDWWYDAIAAFRGPREGKLISTQNEGKSAKNHIATRFNSLKNSQRSTLLDLTFCVSNSDEYLSLSKICKWLSIVQKRSSLAIYEDVIALYKLGLVKRDPYDEEHGESDNDRGLPSEFHIVYRSRVRGYEKFFKKAMIKNPAYDTRRSIRDNKDVVTFESASAPPELTVLFVDDCEQLEVVDLSGFRKLRSLAIHGCGKLREMIGWECLQELGRLEISDCPLLEGYPPLSKIPSLQELLLFGNDRGGELDVSGCVRLHKLEIRNDEALSSIRGLEDLHSLTVLELSYCKALQNLPDIGHMKDLTHLLIEDTPVEEIKGVEKLLSLKVLYCWRSKLKTLPDLSHLPHLQKVHLEECPVVDDPSSPYYQQGYREYNTTVEHIDVSDASDSECH